MTASGHTPVMLREVMEALMPRDGGVYVDATFGAGGYSRAIVEAAECTVWGIDRDPEAAARGADQAKRYSGRLTVLCGRFGDMLLLLADRGVDKVDGVAFDLGVSSMQIDDAGRGFSFRNNGPLDMRMSKTGMSAADVVNSLEEKELADIIYKYGEERASRKIARAIVEVRGETPFTGAAQLADLVRRVVRRSKDGIDPATRTFQALRIYVNDELEELERGLCAAESLLAPGGRLAVVSFHSLEDRQVKNFLRRRSGAAPRGSRHHPSREGTPCGPGFRLLRRGAVKPSTAETAANPRARSARLRTAERTDAAARPASLEGRMIP
ncbi:MAG: 16S rRNA (cytosine(1402)-N(4))-methyltransferase [Rhodospirillales bacterium RIFCSPLOWO2_12_FULL_58_28]|nr:MAG: 16S rRNA (cytosine(1402)-N(4))-methyltransferase [Rhodospirillales bacterium RIFCSPLOWO2_02_FULL_58_16]OHC78638.1 MAG: 16S rRNA (cytosine(1402)-N(4))-methyltransferase [Rhodospirillales bacterium RIFCSPLOWO2_12_FULL_58_28]